MAKFCGNCGTALEENAKVCGNCGTAVEIIEEKAVQKIPGIDYADPEKKAKTKKKIKTLLSLAAVIVVLCIAFNIALGFVGYRGAVRKIMNAFEDYDVDTFVSMASDMYFSYGDEDYAHSRFETQITNLLDYYEDSVGYDFKLKYDIESAHKLSKHRFENLIESMSGRELFDPNIIKKAMIVVVEVDAEGSMGEMESRIEMTLTKEDGSWKILYFNQ